MPLGAPDAHHLDGPARASEPALGDHFRRRVALRAADQAQAVVLIHEVMEASAAGADTPDYEETSLEVNLAQASAPKTAT